MKKNILKSIVLAGLLFTNSVYADENKLDQSNISSANADEGLSQESMFDWIDSFEEKYDVSMGLAHKGKTFFSGVATVRVGPLDPAYAKELSITYDKAMLDLQSNFVMQTYGRMTSERLVDFLEDDATNAREFDKTEIENAKKNLKDIKSKQEFINKALNYVADTVNLNDKLEEYGASPKTLQGMTINQKKELYKDNFKKDMIKKAVASISGLVPIQTKILPIKTDMGTATQVGVIAVMSEKTIQFAEDISRGRETNVKGNPKNIKDVLPKNKKEYLNEFGLRFLYDDQGRPMLLSYGRWSVVNTTKNPAKYLRKIQSAQEKAQMQAESAIGEFMKTNIQVSQGQTLESVSQDIASKITELDSDGNELGTNESINEIGETIDKSFKKVKSSSTFKLRGQSAIKKWKVKDENGILHVGTVVTWTYKQLENANNIENKKFRTNKELKKNNSKVNEVSRKSKVINDVNDF